MVRRHKHQGVVLRTVAGEGAGGGVGEAKGRVDVCDSGQGGVHPFVAVRAGHLLLDTRLLLGLPPSVPCLALVL